MLSQDRKNCGYATQSFDFKLDCIYQLNVIVFYQLYVPC